MLDYQRQGTGPDVVLVHGFLGSGKIFASLTTELARRFTVTTLDLPGFGGSYDEPVPDSVEALSDLVADNVEAIGIRRCAMLGHSLGAWIALEISLRRPRLLEKMVLYGGSPDGICPDRFETYEASIARIRAQGIEAFSADLTAEWFRDGRSAERYALARAAGEGANESAAIKHVESWNAWRTSDRLAQVSTPTLIACGDNDRSTHPDLSIQMWHAINASQLFIIPNAGHIAHLEYPQVFNSTVETFLGG